MRSIVDACRRGRAARRAGWSTASRRRRAGRAAAAGRASVSSKASSASTSAIATRPPGATCARAQRRNPSRPAGPQQLHGLHRRHDEREVAPLQREVARHRRRPSARPGPRRAARRSSSASSAGSMSSATTSWPRRARSSVTRPVPAPTSRIGPLRRGGELAPERDVGVVAAALDVVPDDVLGAGAHANDPVAAPRATSSSRSASIAVYVGSAISRPSPSASAASSAALEVGLDVQALGRRRPRTSAAARARRRACRCTSRAARGGR